MATLKQSTIQLQLEYNKGILSYKSKTNKGFYSYDPTETNSEYPIAENILLDFKHCLSDKASQMLSHLQMFYSYIDDRTQDIEFPNLLPAQNSGVNKMLRMRRVILCDAVGNGKTIQALTVANYLADSCIYVTSKQLIDAVKEEAEIWATNLPIKDSVDFTGPGIHVTNYEQIVKLTNKQLAPKNQRKILIIDEAHNVKNRNAKRSEVINTLAKNSEYLILLTGTPIEKNPNDLWHIMNMIDPLLFPSYWRWYNYFTTYHELSDGRKVNEKPRNLETLHSILKGVYIRRESDREEANFVDVRVDQYPEERKVYNKFLKTGYVAEYDLQIQNQLTRQIYLRQLAIETSALTNEYLPSAKLNAVINLLMSFPKEEKVVIFSSFRKPLERLYDLIGPNLSTLYELDRDISFTKPILLVTYQSGGIGMNLQESHTGILIDLPQRSIIFQQALGRLERIGQKVRPTFYLIRANKTIDERVNYLMGVKLSNFREIVIAKD